VGFSGIFNVLLNDKLWLQKGMKIHQKLTKRSLCLMMMIRRIIRPWKKCFKQKQKC
jgi:3-methyladenine DNA glycosylase/8-oxoguanine DNA glycosylase